MSSVLVTGATSPIGDFLLPRLADRGVEVHALSRTPPPASGAIWHRGDLAAGVADLSIEARCLIHLAPLWLLPGNLPAFSDKGVRRVVAFGSTSRFTKGKSASAAEREVALRLAAAEAALAEECEKRGIAWTVFRPTLIYGAGRDRNITTIRKFVRRFGFFPVAGGGRGLRQPVHAEDLAAACVAALDCPAAFNRAYDLSGGETLSYREMVRAVFAAENRPARIVDVPLPLFRLLIQAAALAPRFRFIDPEMASRMSEDLCFDHSDAARDFGYAPRRFSGP